MKLCPRCQSQYTDDTLKFCLQDGTPLEFASQADTPTAVLNETETQTVLGGGKFQVPIDNADPEQYRLSYVETPPDKKGGNTVMAVMFTLVGMLILFCVVGIAVWIYLRKPQTQMVPNSTNSKVLTPPTVVNNEKPSPPKAVQPSPTPAETTNANTTPPKTDDLRIQSEVIRSLDAWRSKAQFRDLDSHMGHYAATVDYYNRTSATSAYVRADKMRAFNKYTSLKIDLSNITVTADPSGDTVTAIMDKEWDFQGDGSSSGKVRQMIKFRRIDGELLIIAEKDLKLYYKQ